MAAPPALPPVAPGVDRLVPHRPVLPTGLWRRTFDGSFLEASSESITYVGRVANGGWTIRFNQVAAPIKIVHVAGILIVGIKGGAQILDHYVLVDGLGRLLTPQGIPATTVATLSRAFPADAVRAFAARHGIGFAQDNIETIEDLRARYPRLVGGVEGMLVMQYVNFAICLGGGVMLLAVTYSTDAPLGFSIAFSLLGAVFALGSFVWLPQVDNAIRRRVRAKRASAKRPASGR